MIRDLKTAGPPSRPGSGEVSLIGVSRQLSEATEALRSVEFTALSATAETLAEVAASLSEAAQRLEGMGAGAILTVEQAAVELGYVDDEGSSRTKAFAKAAAEKGFRRHVLNANNIYYIRRELYEDVARLPG